VGVRGVDNRWDVCLDVVVEMDDGPVDLGKNERFGEREESGVGMAVHSRIRRRERGCM